MLNNNIYLKHQSFRLQGFLEEKLPNYLGKPPLKMEQPPIFMGLPLEWDVLTRIL